MAAAKAKPFRLDTGPAGAGIGRAPDGRFMLDEPSEAKPPNPLAEEEEGKQPKEWAPGIGQCTDPLTGEENPYSPAEPPANKPMKLGG
jgi:hypothetical protein